MSWTDWMSVTAGLLISIGLSGISAVLATLSVSDNAAQPFAENN